MLIECEAAIKSIIVWLDRDAHDFIIEDLDDTHLVVKENMVALLKQKLDEVRSNRPPPPPPLASNTWLTACSAPQGHVRARPAAGIG